MDRNSCDEIVKTQVNTECSDITVMNNIVPALKMVAETAELYTSAFKSFQETIKTLKPVFESIATLSKVFKAANALAENQYVVFEPLSRDVVNNLDSEDVNSLAEKYLINDTSVSKTISACGLSNNSVFVQSIDAFINGAYDLAILGLTATLDRVLSENSRSFRSIKIKPRCESIIKRVEDKGEDYLDDMDAKDYLLYMTYPRALELFGERSNFSNEEPKSLNRHW